MTSKISRTEVKTSPFLAWCRSWSRRVPLLHGVLIAQMILMPFPPSSHAVWVEIDTDGDGIMDSGYDDGTTPPEEPPPPNPDSDGDGLPDADEAAAGSDPYSPDSDGDGVTDADEVNLTGTDPTSADSDGDGISDYNEFYGNNSVDEDNNGPGETPYDHDGDGIPDPVDPDPLSPTNDPDSDGDYVPDSQDSDPYNPSVWNDQNNNGINDDAETPTTDADGDGVSDETDSHPADISLSNDWNYNGTNDQDEDWDGDGVTNLQDSHPNSNVLWCDWNGNGVNDDAEAGLNDSDGDGALDNSDSHPFNNSLWEDWNSNGCNDSQEQNNADGDGAPDFQDSDPNDFNLWEDWNRNGTNDSQEQPPNPDRDGDLSPNETDSDPDNSSLWSDWNRNGINDDQEPPPQDDDGDGQPNSTDSDPSNSNLWEDWNRNGYNDSTEGNHLDDDNDGHPNNFDTHPQDGLLWNDQNGNGMNDESETIVTDTDGDGYSDELDTHPADNTRWNDHNGNGTNDELEVPPDSDLDGISDAEDEFPYDYDNDGLSDSDEISRGTNPAVKDTDGDGLHDGEEVYAGTDPLDLDTDNDGLTDFEELRVYFSDPLAGTETTSNPTPPGTPTQPTSGFYANSVFGAYWAAQANIADLDADGIPDAIEAIYAPLVVTRDGDLDGDGQSNHAEYLAGTNIIGAGSAIIISYDHDGDGLSDSLEDAWNRVYPGILNKLRFADAWEDPDGDGLLTFEEINKVFGSRLHSDPMRMFALSSNPARACTSGRQDNGYGQAHVQPPDSADVKETSQFYRYRESMYSPWMSDGSLRLAFERRLLSAYAQGTNMGNFGSVAYIYSNWVTTSYKVDYPVADPEIIAGSDMIHFGYLDWLAETLPTVSIPIGGIFSAEVQQRLLAGEALADISVMNQLLASEPVLRPADDDIDDDGMPNGWEARYFLNFRTAKDADIVLDLSPSTTLAERETAMARVRNSDGSIRVYPVTYSSASGFTEVEWIAMNLADPDHDGLPNLLEWEQNLNPRLPDWAETQNRDADDDGFTDWEERLAGTLHMSASSHPLITLSKVSGDNQQTPTKSVFAEPMMVRVLQQNGQPKSGVRVVFSCAGIQMSDALSVSMSGDSSARWTSSSLQARTDGNGLAAVHVLAPSSGGTFTITATAPVIAGTTLTFAATAQNITEVFPPEIKMIKGGFQTGVAGKVLADSFAVQVFKPTNTTGVSIPVPNAVVTFSSPQGSFLLKDGTLQSGTTTLTADSLGSASVRFIAPASAGRINIRASISNGRSVVFPLAVIPGGGTGGGTGGTTGGTGETQNPTPNPPFYLAWQAPFKSADVFGGTSAHRIKYEQSVMELDPLVPKGDLPENKQTHYVQHGTWNDSTPRYHYHTYEPGFAMLPSGWSQEFSYEAPPRAGDKLSYDSVPDYDTVRPESGGLWLHLAEGSSSKLGITVISTELVKKARLVALDPVTHRPVVLPQGTVRTFLPVAYFQQWHVGTASWTQVLDKPFEVIILPGRSNSGPEPVIAHQFSVCPLPAEDNLHVRIDLVPMEQAPDVLAVNTNFDERKLKDGFAKPDAEDTTLQAISGPNAGKIVTTDLHEGFFGLRPGILPYTETAGAVVKIKKLDKNDLVTGTKQTGHVRMYKVWGDTDSQVLPIELYNPDSLVANDIGPLLYTANPNASARYYLEGVKPGKITLEFSYQKDSTNFKCEQEFLVCTQKSRDAWLAEITEQIKLETSVDMSTYNTTDDFNTQKARIQQVYRYYEGLHRRTPNVQRWGGLAKRAACPVYAGLSDAQYGQELSWLLVPIGLGGVGIVSLGFFQEVLIHGGHNIFSDLGWQCRAYERSGFYALKHVKDKSLDGGAIRGVELDPWLAIHFGETENNLNSIIIGARALAFREQRFIVQPAWDRITQLPTSTVDTLFSWLSDNPLPGEAAFTTAYPGKNIVLFDERWPWVETNMLPQWGSMAEPARNTLVNDPLINAAAVYSRVSKYSGLPIK